MTHTPRRFADGAALLRVSMMVGLVMLELKGTAQGVGEMTMVTVLVKDDPQKTDQLYEQLMGSPPMQHGSGLGLPQNRARKP